MMGTSGDGVPLCPAPRIGAKREKVRNESYAVAGMRCGRTLTGPRPVGDFPLTIERGPSNDARTQGRIPSAGPLTLLTGQWGHRIHENGRPLP
jgi:hypothetical protein